MDWTKVVTAPLGLAGFALALVFGVAARVLAQRRRKDGVWAVSAAIGCAAICILGGLILSYRSIAPIPASNNSQNSVPPPPTMRIGKIEQQTEGGTAVAGVQGNVTINSSPKTKEVDPKR